MWELQRWWSVSGRLQVTFCIVQTLGASNNVLTSVSQVSAHVIREGCVVCSRWIPYSTPYKKDRLYFVLSSYLPQTGWGEDWQDWECRSDIGRRPAIAKVICSALLRFKEFCVLISLIWILLYVHIKDHRRHASLHLGVYRSTSSRHYTIPSACNNDNVHVYVKLKAFVSSKSCRKGNCPCKDYEMLPVLQKVQQLCPEKDT
jgi:hypothetical protein